MYNIQSRLKSIVNKYFKKSFNFLLQCIYKIRPSFHKFRVIFSIVLFLNIVIFFWFLGRTNEPETHFDSVPIDENLSILTRNTSRSLSQRANMPSCNYEEIVLQNQFVFDRVNRNEVINGHTIRLGGEYIPSDCHVEFSTAIIVPYRNRSDQLNSFIIYIHNFLRLQRIHYRILLIEQSQERRFNRAKLFNIGSIYAIEAGFPCLILHDIDLLPMNLGNLYVCSTQPRHMASNIDKNNFKMPYNKYVGGVISMTPEVLESINGMSNIYYGWGAEDDDLLARLTSQEIQVIRFDPSYGRYTMMKHKPEIPNGMRSDLLRNAVERMHSDGLNCLIYTLNQIEELPFYTRIEVEV